MSLISINNLTFGYEGAYELVFDNVSLQIDTSWKLGLVGRNGRGKTTFLKLLCGGLEYGGNISAGVSFEYFPYELDGGDKAVWQVILEKFEDIQIWELERELNLLKLGYDVLEKPFNILSGGERTKVTLAALFLKQNGFLLIDEPTNHLDLEGRRLVGEYLESKSGFILVSHDRRLLDSCTTHTLSIDRSGISLIKGNYSVWAYEKRLADEFELSKNNKLKKEIARLNEAAMQKSGWADKTEKSKHEKISGLRPDRGYIGHKAAKLMKSAKNLEERQNKAIEEKSSLLKNIDSADSLKLTPLKFHSDTLVTAENLRAVYPKSGELFNVSFEIKRGERIALVGKNGSGKSTLLKLIAGGDIGYLGSIRIGGGLKVSYVKQDVFDLKGNLKDFAQASGIDESLFKTILRKLGFSREQFDLNIESFSMGQKKKTAIAKSLSESAHLYIWDEPLNYVDILSRVQIEELILFSRPTMIFVEHDREFIDSVADKIVDLD